MGKLGMPFTEIALLKIAIFMFILVPYVAPLREGWKGDLQSRAIECISPGAAVSSQTPAVNLH